MKNPFARTIRYKDGLPVLPGAFPVVGHIPALYHGGIDTLREGHRTLGPLFWCSFALGQWCLLCEGQQAYDILKRRATSSQHYKSSTGILLGEFMLVQDDPSHRHLRSALSGPFSPRGLAATGIGGRMAKTIEASVERWASERRIRVLPETQIISLEIIFQILGIEAQELPAWSAQYRALTFGALPGPATIPGSPKHRAARARKWLDNAFREIILAARERPAGETLLTSLVHAKDEDGERLSETELIDNLRSLVLAGHETTASAMAWVVLELGRRPDLWDALCEEVQREREAPASPGDLSRFPFAEALFREATRLYAPVLVTTRQLTDWMAIHSHRIPPQTIVGVSPALLARDPGLYLDPDRFDPARWLGRGRTPSSIEMVAFGGGPHFCLGYHLAWLEVVQLAVALSSRMMRVGLRPRIDDGPAPREIFFPLRHPTPGARIDFTEMVV
ncbi:MAG TPA: cytochrome P450 [Polyangiaceae bacterium]|jgi:cytochrome P450 monooxygenase|nr:cytochrome P450 [Polyangiaceae bacterium]